MNPASELAILVVAAGRGARAGGGIPKQYRSLAGQPLLARTLGALCARLLAQRFFPLFTRMTSTSIAPAQPISKQSPASLARCLAGPRGKQASIWGWRRFQRNNFSRQLVLIHDAARLFVSDKLVHRAVAAAKIHGAAIPGVALTDTIKEVDTQASVIATAPRARLRAVQTPQAFRFELILAAHRKAASAGNLELTDDAAVAAWAGHRVHVFEGEASNMKVTTSEDLALAEARLMRNLADVRIGQGYDVHALGPGDHIWLGGLKIEHDHGLVGYSDADVLSHAITDALLGALADGDIGLPFSAERSAMARCGVADFSRCRGRESARARRRHCPYRRHPRLRTTEDRTAPRRDPGQHRQNRGNSARPCRDQGNDIRGFGVYRARGRHRVACRRNHPPAALSLLRKELFVIFQS